MADISKERLEQLIIEVLRNIYDPEIPVNIYELGLIYEINISDDFEVKILMTLTTPNCPVAESMPNEVRDSVAEIPEVKRAEIELTFEPPWDQELLSDEAKLELGLL